MRNIQLDDDLVEVIQEGDESIERTARELIVLELYRRGNISSGKAAQLLGMSRVEFIRYSGRLGIPNFDMTDEEWEVERCPAWVTVRSLTGAADARVVQAACLETGSCPPSTPLPPALVVVTPAA